MAVEPWVCLQLATAANNPTDCFRIAMKAPEQVDYLPLVAVAAVTVVACVLILNAAGEIYLSERVEEKEPGGPEAPNKIISKYQGRLARTTRWLIITLGAFLAAACTTIFFFVNIDVFVKVIFDHDNLKKSFIALVSFTIVMVCWIAFFTIILRWRHMRDCIAPGRHWLST